MRLGDYRIFLAYAILLFVFSGCVIPPETTEVAPQPTVTTSPQFDPRVYNRVAIYVQGLTQRRIDQGSVRAVEDEFTRAAIAHGYTVAARSDMEAIDRELKIQASDFTEAAMAKRARALNVSAIILVSLNALDIERYDPWESSIVRPERPPRSYRARAAISARMISAAEAQVIWLSSYGDYYHLGSNRDYGQAGQSLQRVAAVVAQSIPVRHR